MGNKLGSGNYADVYAGYVLYNARVLATPDINLKVRFA